MFLEDATKVVPKLRCTPGNRLFAIFSISASHFCTADKMDPRRVPNPFGIGKGMCSK